MTVPSNDYEVGYGRPPTHTRWKKGQCGNPKRIRKRATKPAVELIDDFFAAKTKIVENGMSRRATNFEVILLQLSSKAMAGHKGAMNTLLRYQQFAASRGGMRSVEFRLGPDAGDQNG
jgi:hypothetical protein